MFRQITIVVLILGIFGCGTMFKDEDTENRAETETAPADTVLVDESSISIPTKISFEIPPSLTNPSEVNECVSSGYTELKESVRGLEIQKNEIERNLNLVRQVMDEIVQRCQGIELEKICLIEANQLHYTDEEWNQTGPLGEVEFVKYSSEVQYQYLLSIDMTPFYKSDLGMGENMEIDGDHIVQSIHWSEDERYISSLWSFENHYETQETQIDLVQELNHDNNMGIRQKYKSKDSDAYLDAYFEIIEKANEEKLYEVKYIEELLAIFGDDYKGKFINDSNGEISKNGGYLYVTKSEQEILDGEFQEIKITKEYDTFTQDGQIIQSRYCDNNDSCDLNNTETWFNNGCL